MTMLVFLNKNEINEHFTSEYKHKITKDKLLEIGNRAIDKSITLYEKTLDYIEQNKIKDRIRNKINFIKDKISSLKKEYSQK